MLEWRHDDKAFAEGYQRALISAGSVLADRALQKATELAELGAAGRITPGAQRAMQSQIDALRWMAAHHDSRCYRAPGASGGTEAEADGGLVDNVQVHIYLPSNDRDGP